MDKLDRRTLLEAAGSTAVASLLAGCSGGERDADPSNNTSGNQSPDRTTEPTESPSGKSQAARFSEVDYTIPWGEWEWHDDWIRNGVVIEDYDLLFSVLDEKAPGKAEREREFMRDGYALTPFFGDEPADNLGIMAFTGHPPARYGLGVDFDEQKLRNKVDDMGFESKTEEAGAEVFLDVYEGEKGGDQINVALIDDVAAVVSVERDFADSERLTNQVIKLVNGDISSWEKSREDLAQLQGLSEENMQENTYRASYTGWQEEQEWSKLDKEYISQLELRTMLDNSIQIDSFYAHPDGTITSMESSKSYDDF